MSAPKFPTPAVQLRAALAACKTKDMDFDDAWTAAWGAVRWPHDTPTRRQWKEALNFSQHEFAACYDRIPTATAAHLAHFHVILHRHEGADHDATGAIVA